ncbi:MAG: undecaprenyl-diphosphate phosphatase [Solirubrobacteraceae bacterium]
MRRPRPGGAHLRLREAVALGALHGPAELLPISSSAHTELVPWLLDWEYARLDPELRKAFGVAIHAGTAAGLLIALRGEVGEALRELDRRRIVLLAGSFLPAAAVGYALERPIEERLGTPPTMAAGLLVGAAAMAAADAAGPSNRTREDAGLADALALGAAQACALMPGVSRNGATLTAARLRGFARADANALSRHVALPVIAGATALKGVRLARRGLPPEAARAFVGGTLAAFASTLASARLLRDDRALWPYAAYRSVLALRVLWQSCRRE